MNSSMIFLYGLPGSGKSTIGRLLARNLDLPFYDLDSEIEKQAGMPVPQIFSGEGEPGFRARERAALEKLLAGGGGVVALGGGALLDPENRANAEASGPVLFLNAVSDVLLARVNAENGSRPLLSGDTASRMADLMARRASHYASFPLRLDTTSLSPEEAAWQAQVRLGMFRVHGMGSSPYDVRVLPGGVDSLGELMAVRGLKGPVALVSDENVGAIYARRVQESLQKAGYSAQVILVPPGESNKTIATVIDLWDAFLSAGLERGNTVVALGGGVTGDMAGFAASAYLRGIRWVAVPTTLLAMIDASMGGKTGVDLPAGKNLVGAFHAPALVLADPQTLSTLPLRELSSGMAEVVKHGVIGDPDLFTRCAEMTDLEKLPGSPDLLAEIVRRAMAVKVRIIEEDPFEKGRRAVLNLGHTIGHAVELASDFNLRHGEAVAVGMVAEARLAESLGLADAGLAEEIAVVLRGLNLPCEIPSGLDSEIILQAIERDKKKSGGKVRFALPVRIGEAKIGIEIGEKWREYAIGLGIARA